MKKLLLLSGLCVMVVFPTFAQWADVTPPFMTPGQNNSLSPISSTSAFIFSRSYTPGSLVLFRTINGGTTWDTVDIGGWNNAVVNISAGRFVDESFGFCYGYKAPSNNVLWLLKTTDSGNTWQEVSTPFVSGQVHMLDFFDTSNGLIIVRTGPSTIYEVFTTSDGGQTWTANTPLSYRIKQYHIKPGGSCVGLAEINYPNLPKVLTTNDYGASWTVHDAIDVNDNWATYRKQIFLYGHQYYVDETTGYSLYEESVSPYVKQYHLTKTTDGGDTWFDEGLIWKGLISEIESADESLWILTDQNLFRKSALTNQNSTLTQDTKPLLFPNPVRSGTPCYLNMGNNHSGEILISLFSSSGLLAAEMSVEVINGNCRIPVEKLNPGVYFVNVESTNRAFFTPVKLVLF